jgi:ABC-type transport system involved in multi-copper enzyme maturation permease subunit
MNPVFWLELRLRLRERKLWVLSLLFLLILLAISGTVVASTLGENIGPSGIGQIGATLLFSLISVLMGVMILIGCLGNAGRISEEREQRTLPGLLNNPQSASRIVIGKLLGGWAFTAWFFFLSLPFFAMVVVWGGVPLARASAGLAACLLTGLTVAAVSLGFSGFFKRSITSYLAVGLFLLFWMGIVPILGALANNLIQETPRQAPSPVVSYLFYNHNPVVVLVNILGGSEHPVLWPLLYAAGVWCLMIWAGIGFAVRGLKRGLFERF